MCVFKCYAACLQWKKSQQRQWFYTAPLLLCIYIEVLYSEKVYFFLILVFPGTCGVKPPLQTNTPTYSLTS